VNPDTLKDLGHALLANVVADLGAASIGVPARQIFAHGRPARDCDQIAVWIESILSGDSGRTRVQPLLAQGLPSAVTSVVTWGVEIATCAPAVAVALPSAGAVTAEGDLGATYAWALHRILQARWTGGSLFAPAHLTYRGKEATLGGFPQLLMEGSLVIVNTTVVSFTQDTAP